MQKLGQGSGRDGRRYESNEIVRQKGLRDKLEITSLIYLYANDGPYLKRLEALPNISEDILGLS